MYKVQSIPHDDCTIIDPVNSRVEINIHILVLITPTVYTIQSVIIVP